MRAFVEIGFEHVSQLEIITVCGFARRNRVRAPKSGNLERRETEIEII